jgi:hypothetical protein
MLRIPSQRPPRIIIVEVWAPSNRIPRYLHRLLSLPILDQLLRPLLLALTRLELEVASRLPVLHIHATTVT